MSKHQDLIGALQAAERVIVAFDADLEGDFKAVGDGYKVLVARFKKEFGREWKPTRRSEKWVSSKETSSK